MNSKRTAVKYMPRFQFVPHLGSEFYCHSYFNHHLISQCQFTLPSISECTVHMVQCTAHDAVYLTWCRVPFRCTTLVHCTSRGTVCRTLCKCTYVVQYAIYYEVDHTVSSASHIVQCTTHGAVYRTWCSVPHIVQCNIHCEVDHTGCSVLYMVQCTLHGAVNCTWFSAPHMVEHTIVPLH